MSSVIPFSLRLWERIGRGEFITGVQSLTKANSSFSVPPAGPKPERTSPGYAMGSGERLDGRV
jgi:hypothetical protein